MFITLVAQQQTIKGNENIWTRRQVQDGFIVKLVIKT